MKKRVLHIFFSFLMIAGLFSAPVPAMAAAGGSFDDTWDWANPLPQGNDLKAVACDGSRYVAVGVNGAAVTSTGGETWVNADLDFDIDYNAAAYGGGLFLAGGESGSVGRSADGLTWTCGSTYEEDYDTGIAYGTEAEILGMTYGEGRFVAVGSGFIITSADGESWSEEIAVSGTLNGVAYGNGYFVAVGNGGVILYSADGIEWRPDASGTAQNLNAVTYGNGMYIAVGQNGTILNAASLGSAAWTKSGTISGAGITGPFDGYLHSVSYGNGLHVIASDDMYLTSSNGTDWTVTLDVANLTALYGVVSGNDGFTAVGTGGLIITIDSGSTSWTKRSSGSKSYLSGMTYDNGLFVAVGTNEIMTSTNGVDWVSRLAPDAGVGTLESVAGNGSGGFAAVGYGYDNDENYIGTLAYSTDGTTWQKAPDLGTDMMLRGVAYGLNSDGIGLYVAVGYSWSGSDTGVIYTSEDGDSWTQVTVPGVIGRLTDVTYGNGMFAAVGENDTLMTSADGTDWTTKSRINKSINPGVISYTGIAYGGGLFIAVGLTGEIVTSADGAVWNDLDKYESNLEGIAYGEGYFVAAGQSGLILDCTVSDGVAGIWEQTGRDTTKNRLNAAAYGNGVYAVVGDNGAILYSPPVSKYALTITAGTGGRITKGTSGSYAAGTVVNISASPSSGYTFSGWTSSGGGTFASSASASTTFTMPAAATTVTANFTVSSSGDPDNNGSSGSGSPGSGTKTEYGTLKKEGSVCTTVIDSGKLSLGEKGNVIVISVTDTTAKNVTFQLTVADLKKIADNGSMLQLETPFGIYKLPAVEIDFKSISKKYPDIDYSNIRVNVAFVKTDGSNAVLNGAGIIGQPVEISVTLEAGSKKIELDEFTQYVERDLPVAAGEEFATGVVIEDNGTLRHVPTKETTINGKRYAAVFSRTNSVYCLIDNKVSFNDMTGHWAEETVSDMASRLIISGVGNNAFVPDSKITRAQFTAIVVRALGLKCNKDAAFTDVSSENWYHDPAAAAYKYGIVLGGADGRFRPNDDITRQEAMVMVSRAMEIARMDTTITDEEASSALSGFTDSGMIPGWAEDAAATAVESGIVSGSNGKLRPNDKISRAETAVMVQRLLEKAGLI